MFDRISIILPYVKTKIIGLSLEGGELNFYQFSKMKSKSFIKFLKQDIRGSSYMCKK